MTEGKQVYIYIKDDGKDDESKEMTMGESTGIMMGESINEFTDHLERWVTRMQLKSEHQQQVELFLKGIGHPIPDSPQLATNDRLLAWARLLVEEVWETINRGMGREIYVDSSVDIRQPIKFTDLHFSHADRPNTIDIADGCGDLLVVATGLLSLCGIADKPLLEEINSNNLLKLKNGRLCPHTGKFLKPEGHPKPHIAGCLIKQIYNDEPKETTDVDGSKNA
jgi:predicted HAD superfamily Cof-like phosphohydrolase